MIISVEGNIGSGKSTLVDNLKRHLSNKEINYVFVQELLIFGAQLQIRKENLF